MSPRTGRPKADNPKNIDVKVRFDEESNRKLLEYCENRKLTRTEAIRKAVNLLIQSENKKE